MIPDTQNTIRTSHMHQNSNEPIHLPLARVRLAVLRVRHGCWRARRCGEVLRYNRAESSSYYELSQERRLLRISPGDFLEALSLVFRALGWDESPAQAIRPLVRTACGWKAALERVHLPGTPT